MKDHPGNNGECPVLDKMPDLTPLNEVAVEIYYQARTSAQQVQAEDKTFLYIRPEAADVLMRINQVPESDRPEILRRLFILQDMDNRLRPARRRKHVSVSSGRGRRR